MLIKNCSACFNLRIRLKLWPLCNRWCLRSPFYKDCTAFRKRRSLYVHYRVPIQYPQKIDILFGCWILRDISDEQTEYQINDRLSFMRFLGLGIKDKVPDAKTIWLFKERLIEGKVSKKLFDTFWRELVKQNLIGKEGTII